MRKDFLELGTAVGTHGVRGEIRVNPLCDTPDFAKQFKTVYKDEKGNGPTKVVSCRPHGNVILLKLEGVDTMEAAESLRGTVFFVRRDDAKLKKGTWFIDELLNCTVTDHESGRQYGTLTEVIPMPANDVWTVTDERGREYLLPAIKDVIREVDIDAGVIRITPMRGIFDELVEAD